MIRAVICDDETASLAIIRYLIESEGLPIEIVGTLLTDKADWSLFREKSLI